jgi:hypothetical protein
LLIERQKLNNDDDVDIAVLLYYLAQKNGRWSPCCEQMMDGSRYGQVRRHDNWR